MVMIFVLVLIRTITHVNLGISSGGRGSVRLELETVLEADKDLGGLFVGWEKG